MTDEIPQTRRDSPAKIAGQPGETKERPVLVASGDARNQFADDIIVVPFSTTLRPAPTHVYLPAGFEGIFQASMAKCELITTLDRVFLARGPLGGQITAAQMREVEKAIMRAISVVVP